MDGNEPVLSQEGAISACLAHVTSSHRLAEAALASRSDMLRAARDLGATWEQLGEAMGMSRQTAHKRFAHVLGEAEWQSEHHHRGDGHHG